jgi:NitT/TauT family transport system substrate-binding protein
MERLKIWKSKDTGTGQDGMFLEPQWKNFIDFMLRQKLLSEPVPLDKIYTNELISQINEFDREKVKKQAVAFDIDRVK